MSEKIGSEVGSKSESESKASYWPGIVAGMGMMGAAAYAMASSLAAGKKAKKTPEEYESEIEKWEKQTRMAHTALLDLSVALSEKCRALADAEETARLNGLATDRAVKEFSEEHEKLKKEAAGLKAGLARAEEDLMAEIVRLKSALAAAESALAVKGEGV
jgi:predicted  nucleic acid-binding Zn-ribbon protein